MKKIHVARDRGGGWKEGVIVGRDQRDMEVLSCIPGMMSGNRQYAQNNWMDKILEYSN